MYTDATGSKWDYAIDIPTANTDLTQLIGFCNKFFANAYSWYATDDKATYRFFFKMKHHFDAFKESFAVDNPVVPPAPVMSHEKTVQPSPKAAPTGNAPIRDALGRFAPRPPGTYIGKMERNEAGVMEFKRAGSPTQVTATTGTELARQLKGKNKPKPPQSIHISINGRRYSQTFQHLPPEKVEELGKNLIAICQTEERNAAPQVPNWTYEQFRSTVIRQFELDERPTPAPTKTPADKVNREDMLRFFAAADDGSKLVLFNAVVKDVFLDRAFYLSVKFGPREIGEFTDWFEETFGVSV